MNAPLLAYSLSAGLHFAILQMAYFFLAEVFLSAGHVPYFILSFWWLVGLIGGLWFTRDVGPAPVYAVGVGAYAILLMSLWIRPFDDSLNPLAWACIAVSGMGPGHFFGTLAVPTAQRARVLLHENNGFIAGLLLALFASAHRGVWLLYGGPLAGLALVLVCLGWLRWSARGR